MEQQELIEKIRRLPQESVAEVEEFIDSLVRREAILDRKSLHQALADYAIQHAAQTPISILSSKLPPPITSSTRPHNNEARRSLLG